MVRFRMTATAINNDTLVLVALSGGVDSAVVLNLLKQKYSNVHGISHRHWPESKCCTTACIDTCREQCTDSGVPYSTIDTMVEFCEEIVEPFVQAYESGTTPNPCVHCNQRNRFGYMVKKFMETLPSPASQYKIATGHYARLFFDGHRYWLQRGKDPMKDQSYMLYRLSQEQLSHALFPLGEMEKPVVREMATDWNLASAKNEDSQDICFVEKDYRDFLKSYTGKQNRPGNFLDLRGNNLGQHQGTSYYTRGQRKGLGLGGGPWFVVAIKPKDNVVVLGRRDDLLISHFQIHNCVWHFPKAPENFEATVQVRYHGTMVKCDVHRMNNELYTVTLAEPNADVTPGQSAVFYQGETLVGGGIISNNLEELREQPHP